MNKTILIIILLLNISIVEISAINDSQQFLIMKLNTPTITIGGKQLKKGDTFQDVSTIKWADYKQIMEVKDVATGSLYKFSKKVFESKGAILSVADFFLRTNKASSRDTDTGIKLKKSSVSGNFPDRRIALVIGNSNYFNLSYLRNAQKDASDIANLLLSLGFDVVEAYETNYEEMRTALNKFSGIAGSYDVALFYYAGHGLQDEGKNYLIPVNALLEFRSELRNTLHCDDVLQRMSATGAPTQLVFIDACRNAKNSWSRDVTEGLARMEGGAGTVIVFSTESGKTAGDGEGDNSPFAESLIRNLGVASPSFSETMTAVVRDTYEATEHKQCPLVIGTPLTDFRFNPSADGSVSTSRNTSTRQLRPETQSQTKQPESTTTSTPPRANNSVNTQAAAELVSKGKSLVKKFNAEEAVDYFKRAADQGNVEAHYCLGELYYNGNGVRKSFPTAINYFRYAAEAGLAEAQYMMGVMARNGQGCDKNIPEARQWLQKAAAQGYSGAEKMLNQLK